MVDGPDHARRPREAPRSPGSRRPLRARPAAPSSSSSRARRSSARTAARRRRASRTSSARRRAARCATARAAASPSSSSRRSEPRRRASPARQLVPALAGDPRRGGAGHRRPARGRAANERRSRAGDRYARRARSTACCARSRPVGVLHEEDGRRFALTDAGRAAPLRRARIRRRLGRVRRAAVPPRGVAALERQRPHGRERVQARRTATSVWEYRAQRPEESAIFDRAMAATHALVIARRCSMRTTSGGSGRSSTSAAATGRSSRRSAPNTRSSRGIALRPAPRRRRASTSASGVERGRGQLLRVGARGRRRVRPEVDHPRLGGRGVGRDPPHRAVAPAARCSWSSGSSSRRTRAGDEARGPEHARRPGRQERTLDEFRALFEAAGYELVGDTPTAGGMHVIEGAPTG